MIYFNEAVAFIMGSIVFWPLVIILFGGFWALTENNYNVSGIVLLAIFLFLTNNQYHYLGFFDSWVNDVAFAVGYLVIGSLYSFLRWYLRLRGVQNSFIELRDAFILQYNLSSDFFRTTPVSGSNEERLLAEFIGKFYYGGSASGFNTVPKSVSTMVDLLKYITPVASQNKATITRFIAYWPTSVLWFALSDVVREIMETLYRMFGGLYQKLANSMFKAEEIL
jgi:hypothetical protein